MSETLEAIEKKFNTLSVAEIELPNTTQIVAAAAAAFRNPPAVSAPAPHTVPASKPIAAPTPYKPLPDARALTGGLEGLLANASAEAHPGWLPSALPSTETPRAEYYSIARSDRPISSEELALAIDRSVGLAPYQASIERARLAAEANPVPQPKRSDDVFIDYIANGGVLKEGMSRPEIADIKSTFIAMGMAPQLPACEKKGCSLQANGKFDALTEEALLDFQSYFNLGADGVVGKKTLAAIQIEQLKLTLEHIPDFLERQDPQGVLALQVKQAINASYEQTVNITGKDAEAVAIVVDQVMKESGEVARSLSLFNGNIPQPLLVMLKTNGLSYDPAQQRVSFVLPAKAPGHELAQER